MFKNIKQDKKIKIFKNPRYKMDNGMKPTNENNLEDKDYNYLAHIATKKKPKKKFPKTEEMFVKGKKK